MIKIYDEVGKGKRLIYLTIEEKELRNILRKEVSKTPTGTYYLQGKRIGHHWLVDYNIIENLVKIGNQNK